MTPPTCTHCDRPVHARGWCKCHYRRWSDYGDPLKGSPVPDAHAMPDGWYAPTARPEPRPHQGLKVGVAMLGQVVPPTDQQQADARHVLHAMGADDLADMLGLTAP